MTIDSAPTSRSEDAYQRLREAILRGELRPNERLIELDLAERLQISRTPIREVLQRLGTEGLIVRVRRGWRVREHTRDEIGEIYEVRVALEGYAARLAATRAREDEIARIRDIHLDSDATEPRTAREHLVEVNDHFHAAIVEAAHNGRLLELARQSREYFFNYRIARLYSEPEATASVQGHEEIVQALLARDGGRAEAAMRRHILQALDVLSDKVH